MTRESRDGLPVVAIVGRPNVGKSMLFNRITGRRLAVVDNEPGVTRDRHYHEAEWSGRRFVLVDTGGLLPTEDEGMSGLIRVQAESAIGEADAILFVVDRETGPTAVDTDIASLLRRSPKPLLLAVNKTDSEKHELDTHEFYSLGLGEPVPVSALHGRGTGDLLDKLIGMIPTAQPEAVEGVRVAFVGRPNVGKSSLVNRIVGQDVVIVDSAPGTTRDAIDTVVTLEDRRFVLIDTAGLRRKSHVERGVEYYSSIRSLRSIERADVVVLVVDAPTGIVAQDARIAGFVEEAGKGLIVAFNKWDLIEKDNQTAGEFVRHAEEALPFARYAPVVQVSALSGQRVARLLTLAAEVANQAATRIPTSRVNETLMRAADERPPGGGRRASILYATQIDVKPPTFVVFTSDLRAVNHTYRRYLANQLRREYGFIGTPIRILTRKRR
ncbi:MAG: ribosome biogenesis GTPase Der [Candidatus Eisenbacteria bacterium]|nr:ribosome biogenesis GTPase Der [Candidatus Eisenbacteria bacterium]